MIRWFNIECDIILFSLSLSLSTSLSLYDCLLFHLLYFVLNSIDLSHSRLMVDVSDESIEYEYLTLYCTKWLCTFVILPGLQIVLTRFSCTGKQSDGKMKIKCYEKFEIEKRRIGRIFCANVHNSYPFNSIV